VQGPRLSRRQPPRAGEGKAPASARGLQRIPRHRLSRCMMMSDVLRVCSSFLVLHGMG
jgi:hypothetical protein